VHAAIALQEPAGLMQRLFLCYFIADVRTCTINAAIYFIGTFFVLFYFITHKTTPLF